MSKSTFTPTSIFQKVTISLAGLALFLSIQVAASTPTCVNTPNCVYAIDDGSLEFGTLILTTGVFTGISGSSPGSVSSGLAEQGANLYTGTYHGSTLYRVNLDGSITAIGNGSISNGGGYRCTGATTAGLYGFDTVPNLYSVNVASGATTLIGNLGVSGSDLGCSANGALLYATLDDGSCSNLYLINANSGAAKKIGCITYQNNPVRDVNSLVFYDGSLYGNAYDHNLYTIDPMTAQATAAVSTCCVFSGMALPASTYTDLHNFTLTGQDGGFPNAGLAFDQAGNLYGTASDGGSGGYGTVFKLRHTGGWTLSPLYEFAGGSDGAYPEARVTFASNGTLYGTTSVGGTGCNGQGCGVVFNLRPQPRACTSVICLWNKTGIYQFQGPDGAHPYSDVILDAQGNLYGTTLSGGADNDGAVYELMPSNGGWMESVLHSFTGGSDGSGPWAGVTFDSTGNLYGTTLAGASGYGVVFELSPSGSSWALNPLYTFLDGKNDGGAPYAGVILDTKGNLYGAASNGGAGNGGTIFGLTSGSWTFNSIYALSGSGGRGPEDNLVMDSAGNLYGTTNQDGAYGYGSVFELSPSNVGWVFTDLYDFTGSNIIKDGCNPVGGLVIDASGNLYGTAYGCGANGYGVVFEVTPN